MTEESYILAIQKWFGAWPKAEIQKFKKRPESEVFLLHFGIGLAIRNRFFWHLSSEELQKVAKEFSSAGYSDADNTLLSSPDELSGAAIAMLRDWVKEIEFGDD